MNEYFGFATFDAGGSLLGEVTPAHDANGNEIQAGGDKRLFFDAWDRLVRVERTSDGATIQRNRYDCAGRRSSKEFLPVGGTVGVDEREVFFVSDGAREIEELDAAGNLVADYVWGGLYIDQAVQMRRDTDPGSAGLEEFYYHSDSLYSVAALTDASGAVVERYDYSSIYGVHDVSDGSGGAVGAVGQFENPWRFQGRRLDPETGLLHFRQRYLDPAQGRFVSRDPLGLWGDPGNLGNPYAFCANDPVNRVDPLGEFGLGWVSERSDEATKLAEQRRWGDFFELVLTDAATMAFGAMTGGYGPRALNAASTFVSRVGDEGVVGAYLESWKVTALSFVPGMHAVEGWHRNIDKDPLRAGLYATDFVLEWTMFYVGARSLLTPKQSPRRQPSRDSTHDVRTAPTRSRTPCEDPRTQQLDYAYVGEARVEPSHHGGGFHGTDVPPTQALHSGLPGKGINIDLIAHAEPPPGGTPGGSAFRGTSQFAMDPGTGLSGPAYWPGAGGWVYELGGLPTFTLSELLAGKIPAGPGRFRDLIMTGEAESTVPALVHPWQIKGYYPVLEGRGTRLRLGPYVENPNYGNRGAYGQ